MDKMKRYEDFKNESNETDYLTKEELEKVKWTKYKIKAKAFQFSN